MRVLLIDDERNFISDGSEMKSALELLNMHEEMFEGAEIHIVRRYDEAIAWIDKNACPDFIFFDHDIQSELKTGFDVLKYLIEKDLDENYLNKKVQIFFHTQNNIGRSNMQNYWNNYKRYINE